MRKCSLSDAKLEARARKLALGGIKALRRAYELADYSRLAAPDDDCPLKHAGSWGTTYARVCDAVWELFDNTFMVHTGAKAFAKADAVVRKLELAERSKRERIGGER